MSQSITGRLAGSLKPKPKPYEVRDQKIKGFLIRVQPSGRMSYYCEYARAKRVKLGDAQIITPDEARKDATRILADFHRGIDPQEAKRRSECKTLNDFIKLYYRDYLLKSYKSGESTLQRLERRFAKLLGKTMSEINPLQVEKWKKSRPDVIDETLKRDIAVLRAALQKAAEWGIIDKNPLEKYRSKFAKSDETGRPLTGVELGRLYAALPSSPKLLQAIVKVALNTGMRRGELLAMKWADVDFSNETITVKTSTAKGEKTRRVPINPECKSALLAWRNIQRFDGLVFPGRDGKRMHHFKRSWAALLKAASIENFRFHDCRHHFASMLVMNGVDLYTVQQLLGHSDISMTYRYAHLSDEHKRNAVNAVSTGSPGLRLIAS